MLPVKKMISTINYLQNLLITTMVFAIGWIVGRFLITPKGQGSSYTSIKQDAHGSSKIVVILNVQILLTTKPEEPAEDNECG